MRGNSAGPTPNEGVSQSGARSVSYQPAAFRIVAATTMSLLIATLTAFPVRAHGGHFGSNWQHICDTTLAAQCKANDGAHRVHRASLESHQSSAIDHTKNNVYVDISTAVTISYVAFDTLVMDVVVSDGSYGMTGDWGWARCFNNPNLTYGGLESNHTRWCKPQELVFNLSYKQSKYPTLEKTKAIACHEMGHTLGLRHYTTDCMKDPPTSPASGADYTYTYENFVHDDPLLYVAYQ
jgi:hypothetical protein